MAGDKLSGVRIESVTSKFSVDKEGDQIEKHKIVFTTDDLSSKDAGRLLSLGKYGDLEITIAPRLRMTITKTGSDGG